MRFEHIESYQNNAITGTHEEVSYNAPLPALNVLYHLTDSWNLYANTEGSFGTVQYSQIGKAVQSGNVWCTAQSLFQQSMELPDLILDMNKVFTEGTPNADELKFLTKLQ